MTLGELIDVYDANRELESQHIELCRPGMNWEDFDSRTHIFDWGKEGMT